MDVSTNDHAMMRKHSDDRFFMRKVIPCNGNTGSQQKSENSFRWPIAPDKHLPISRTTLNSRKNRYHYFANTLIHCTEIIVYRKYTQNLNFVVLGVIFTLYI